jgi:hypothetical protein
MIKTEFIEINGMKFKRTYSDENFMIERDGVRYCDAIDPIEFEDRVYIETDEKFEVLQESLVEELN